MKKPKINFFSKTVYGLSTIFFGILFTIFLIGSNVAPLSSNFINEFFNINPWQPIDTGEGVPFNYYKSDFVNEDGSLNHEKMRANSEQVALEVATEGSVLLKNEDNALPLKQGSKVSFLGISSNNYLMSAAGSGHLSVSTSIDLDKACQDVGITINPNLKNAYKMLSSKYGNYLGQHGETLQGTAMDDYCYIEYGINEVPYSEIDSTTVGNVTDTIPDYGDFAFLIISRNCGEDGDTNYYTSECIENNYLDLAYEEIEILNQLESLKADGKIKNIGLIINSAQPMQMKHILEHDIDSILWTGIGGNMSYQQIAQLISGKSNPSGRLIDTYLYDNYSSPSMVNFGDFEFDNKDGLPATTTYSHSEKYLVYSENIYVGYRYFETRYEDLVLNQGNADSDKGVVSSLDEWNYSEEVAYPFGYGLSYTEFEHSGFTVNKTLTGYEAKVNVENVGSVPGKDVVQIYLQKPYTEYDKENNIEKASVELVGFGKTSLLDPDESEVVTINIDESEFKTYDSYNKKTYILEAGDYYLAEGNNAHDALNNILAKKDKTTSDGMDYNGDGSFAHRITINQDDFVKYSTSLATNYPITNQFDDADVKLYEGLGDQFKDFKYLSRSDWDGTYPAPVKMDVQTSQMVNDLQHAQEIVEDEDAVMPQYGQSGTLKLIDLWGYDYDDPRWDDLLKQLTWEEMNVLATMGGGMAGSQSVSAPAGLAKDGPGGIGVGNPTVMCFPSECNMAATFNLSLIEELGNAFGMEIMHVGYSGIYGPGANIHRAPYSGRNWEYYSEDPFISAKMLASEVKGLQNRGIVVYTKHFLLNDSERNRYGVCVFSNEQAIREIYLKAFEYAVTESNMNGIMSSFNRIGCTWTGKHAGLLTNVLRNEWGFIGVVQTDAYVGEHMHNAIFESIIAGNDFTMGGAIENKFDAYKDSPTLVRALYETCHRMLYTKLHSFAMDGVTTTTSYVYITPWWEVALDVGVIVSGVIASASALMLIVSFIYGFLRKRKEHLESINPDPNRKIKYLFDVVSKRAFIISTSVLALLVAASVTVPVTIYSIKNNREPEYQYHTCQSVCPVCGKCQNYDCPFLVCEDKCTCPCEHACPTCGLCLDETINEGKCEIKCGDNLTNYYELEAEDPHVILYPGETGSLGVASETSLGATEKYIGGFSANPDSEIKYVIDSSVEQTVTLFVSVCKKEAGIIFTNSVLVMVNGEIINVPTIVHPRNSDEPEWVTFTDINLGCIKLNKGRNVISFICASSDTGSGFNFNKMMIKANNSVTFYEGPHQCDDICPLCGLCQNEYCTDPVCSEKCVCNLDKKIFSFDNENVIFSGAYYLDGSACFAKANDSVQLILSSQAAQEGVFFLDLEGEYDELNINDVFTLEVNGEVISLQGKLNEENPLKIGKTNLEYGDVNIKLILKQDLEIKIKNFIVGCEGEIDYKNPLEFNVDDPTVLVEGNAYKDSNRYINMAVDNSKDSTITYQLDSSKDTTAQMYLNLGCRQGIIKLKDIFKITVNDTVINTEAQLSNDGADLYDFRNVLIGEVSLVQEMNVIKIQTLLDDINVNTTLRDISFDNTDAEITYSQSGIKMNQLVYEAETAILHQVENFPYVVDGQNSSNNQFLGGVNDAGVFHSGMASIELRVNASEAGLAKFYVNAGLSASCSANVLKLNVNGVDIESSQNWPGSGWYDWTTLFHSNINLNEGENIITLTIFNGASMNIDYFYLESLIGISK